MKIHMYGSQCPPHKKWKAGFLESFCGKHISRIHIRNTKRLITCKNCLRVLNQKRKY